MEINMIEPIFQEIINEFVNSQEVSDLHLRTDDKPILRIKNRLKRIDKFDVIPKDILLLYVKNLFELRYGEEGVERYNQFMKDNREYDMAITLPGSEFRSRINIFKSLGKIGIVFRIIPNKIPDLDILGFYDQHKDKIKEMVTRKEGLVLVTGQTGSGKSTTLAAIVDYLNQNFEKHIITIEDPVEFTHKNNRAVITHREVGEGSDTKTFYSGLKASLREDPDIILVGEIRDADTALAAIQAAQTGHIVFATLHTNSAPETILRIIDMFPANKEKAIKVSLAGSLKMIISQKLAPTLSNKRTLLYELLVSNTSIQNIILSEQFSDIKILDNMRTNIHSDYAMLPMDNCINNRLKENDPDIKISAEIAIDFANDKEGMKNLIVKEYGEDALKTQSDDDIFS
jgi:twitching motility protein PilT